MTELQLTIPPQLHSLAISILLGFRPLFLHTFPTRLSRLPGSTSVFVLEQPTLRLLLAQTRLTPPLRHFDLTSSTGHVYVHVCLNWDILQNAPTIADDDDLNYLDIKVGEAIDMDARRTGYAKCDGEEII
ncbi:hypothetical protein K438DRAFT_1782454 [Mycena galopus ATCC 62051]|nr:hypothetical protein K438DRAFT_1782454 [Mycena galopus ATCC 62051]